MTWFVPRSWWIWPSGVPAARQRLPVDLVRELYVFGSIARGALRPGDVDLNIEYDDLDRRNLDLALAG
jgi:predicted nucleotidyltransferase